MAGRDFSVCGDDVRVAVVDVFDREEFDLGARPALRDRCADDIVVQRTVNAFLLRVNCQFGARYLERVKFRDRDITWFTEVEDLGMPGEANAVFRCGSVDFRTDRDGLRVLIFDRRGTADTRAGGWPADFAVREEGRCARGPFRRKIRAAEGRVTGVRDVVQRRAVAVRLRWDERAGPVVPGFEGVHIFVPRATKEG